MVINLLRVSWRYASLVALAAVPMTPSDLLGVFETARAANVGVFGTHVVYIQCVNRNLAVLFAGHLVARRQSNGTSVYSITPFARGLLNAIEPVADYAAVRYDWLTAVSRRERKVQDVAPSRNFSPEIPRHPESERFRRRAVATTFSVLLAPKWTFAILVLLAAGPKRFSAIIEAADDVVRANLDVVTATSLSRSTLTARLSRLRDLGLVREVADDGGRNPTRPPGGREVAYALTAEGWALLAALEPVARFGIAHDAELAAAVKALPQG